MKISIKKIGRLVRELRDKDVSKTESSPRRDWTIFLIIACLLFVSSAIFHIRMFLSVQSDAFLEDRILEDAPTTLDRKGIEDIIGIYAAKAERLDALLNSRSESYSEVADPSQ